MIQLAVSVLAGLVAGFVCQDVGAGLVIMLIVAFLIGLLLKES